MRHIFLGLFLLLSLYTFSQEKFDSLPNVFFKILEQKGSDQAIDFIYSSNKYISGNLAANLKVKAELKKIISLIGNYNGSEIIDTQFISLSYIRLSYLAKFDRQPLKFNFTMYKPKNNWQLQQLKFDDKVSKGFKN